MDLVSEGQQGTGIAEVSRNFSNQTGPTGDEECRVLGNGTREKDDESEGYISTKDYAYDQSNPLHHGYLQDARKSYSNEFENNSDEDADDEGIDEDYHKRQSIILPQDYLINQLAVALYDFEPENDNELGLVEGDIVYISYRHGQGWLVAENQEGTKTGLVPEEFVSYLEDSDEAADGDGEEAEDEAGEAARPFYLTHYITQGINSAVGQRKHTNKVEESGEINGEEDSITHSDCSQKDTDEWEDIDNLKEEVANKLNITEHPDQ